jgi:hypothetical protein
LFHFSENGVEVVAEPIQASRVGDRGLKRSNMRRALQPKLAAFGFDDERIKRAAKAIGKDLLQPHKLLRRQLWEALVLFAIGTIAASGFSSQWEDRTDDPVT